MASKGELVELLQEAIEPGVFGHRGTVFDPLVGATNIEEICERCGYGAVMQHVQHLWSEKAKRNKLEGSEHTVAACAAVRKDWCERARKAVRRA